MGRLFLLEVNMGLISEKNWKIISGEDADDLYINHVDDLKADNQ